ncbi:MAG: class I SAM-dependent methyltransferase [Acidimicrobiales bacterium]
MAAPEYLRVNHASWEERAPLHAGSADYALERFGDDPTHVSGVVRFDRERLGTLDGLDVVHLQCHIGTDTVSLARLGARSVRGLDFSGSSLVVARDLAARAGADVEFVESDVYDAVDALGAASADLVYTGIGALCWLPDIARWAETVRGLLRPGGRLLVRDCHPVLFSLDDDRDDDLLVMEHPYVETAEGCRFESSESYVDHEGTLANGATIEFNHGIGEVVTAVLDAGLEVTGLVEHLSVPWPALPRLMEPDAEGEWRLRDRPERLPLTFTLQAVVPGRV